MILLDTNVLSAVIAPMPIRAVVDWIDRQKEAELYLSAVTIFEMRTGIDSLPAGRRRRELDDAFEDAVKTIIGGRVISFDWNAASAAGRLAARRRLAGRPQDVRDTQIAGIALAHDATIATRNVHHFEDIGLPIVDPWTA
jgi:predicted nucleic acid-binding protein